MTKSELFNPNNLDKRVLEHLGRRTSVVNILPDIENNRNKYIENIKNDHHLNKTINNFKLI